MSPIHLAFYCPGDGPVQRFTFAFCLDRHADGSRQNVSFMFMAYSYGQVCESFDWICNNASMMAF